jgi:hypothetical protein
MLQITPSISDYSSQRTTIMASDNNDNQPTSTFEEAFADVQVDNHDTRSRFVDPEGLEEELRCLCLNQEDVNKDFNRGCMYKDTVTQNLPFCCLLNNEIDLNQGDMSTTGRHLYRDRLAVRLDGAKEQHQEATMAATAANTQAGSDGQSRDPKPGQGGSMEQLLLRNPVSVKDMAERWD